MNLLDKNWLALSFVITLAFFSCEDPSEIGAGLDPDAKDVKIIYKEIVLSPSENIFIDSLKTSNGDLIWIGKNSSNVYGETSSRAYCKLFTANDIPALVHTFDTLTTTPLVFDMTDTLRKQFYVFDSAILDLRVLALNSNNPSSEQTFTLHEIEDQLFSEVYYLANHDIPILPNDPDDEFSFKFDLERMDSVLNKKTTDTITYAIKHKLSDQLVHRLFEVVRLNPSSKALTTEFKGLAIEPGESNTALIGVNPGGLSGITINYHINEYNVKDDTTIVAKKNLSVYFSLSASSARYNKIQTNRQGSLIGNINPVNGSIFDTQNDSIYFHPASGIYPTISLQPVYEYLDSINELESAYIQILSAQFDFESSVNSGSYNKNVSAFRMFFLNDQNKINTTGLATGDVYKTLVVTDIGYLQNTPTQNPMYAPFYVDKKDVGDPYYKSPRYVGVASYFVTLINKSLRNKDKIEEEDNPDEITVENLVLMPANSNSMNQSSFKKENIKLKLYYSFND